MRPSIMVERASIRTSPGPAGNPGTIGPGDLRRLAKLTHGLKGHIRSLLGLADGDRVLDVGCGPGLDTSVAAGLVGPTGRVAGIDYDASMIREARAARAHGADTDSRVSYLVADAAGLPYRDGTFDCCYCERVLQHTHHPDSVVGEMVRVTKPGGVIVIADTDWATLSIDAPDARVERALVRFVGETLCNGYAGRQLRRLMTSAGLAEVKVEMWPLVWTDYRLFRATSLSLLDMEARAVRAGSVSAGDLADLHGALADADRRGEFFASGAVVVARGRRCANGQRHR